MDITISKNTTLNMFNLVNKISTIEPLSNLSQQLKSSPTTDNSEISDDAKLQYEYMNELKDSTDTVSNDPYIETNTSSRHTFLSKDALDPSFIENYALNYAKIRKEITEGNTKDEATKKIALLDRAYTDTVNEAAQVLSYDFQSFFDYASREWIYDKSNNDIEKFDTEAFKNNVLSLSDKAFSLVNQAFKDNNLDNLEANIENELFSVQSGTTIESMNYKDIKEVDTFLKTIPNFKNHIREYLDDGTYRPVPSNWSTSDAVNAINKEHAMAEDLLKSGKVSSSTGTKVYNAVLKNISAYHKNFAFGIQIDDDQNQINKDKSYYKLLKEQYEKFEKKLEEARRKNNMKMTLMYLEMLAGLKNSLNEISDKLKEDIDAKNNLSKNPNSVVDTDAYKNISNGENFKEEEV